MKDRKFSKFHCFSTIDSAKEQNEKQLIKYFSNINHTLFPSNKNIKENNYLNEYPTVYGFYLLVGFLNNNFITKKFIINFLLEILVILLVLFIDFGSFYVSKFIRNIYFFLEENNLLQKTILKFEASLVIISISTSLIVYSSDFGIQYSNWFNINVCLIFVIFYLYFQLQKKTKILNEFEKKEKEKEFKKKIKQERRKNENERLKESNNILIADTSKIYEKAQILSEKVQKTRELFNAMDFSDCEESDNEEFVELLSDDRKSNKNQTLLRNLVEETTSICYIKRDTIKDTNITEKLESNISKDNVLNSKPISEVKIDKISSTLTDLQNSKKMDKKRKLIKIQQRNPWR